jgi:methionyl aminopeptidase
LTAYDIIDFEDTSPARDGRIKLHGPEAFEGMRKAGRMAAEVLDMLVAEVKPGVTTAHLDKLAREMAFDNGVVPATLFYRGYKHSLCTSVNHVICHGIPGPKPLKNGDIVNIDVTLVVDGWHGDTSRMYMVGEPKRKSERLVDITYEAMMAGINAIKPGVTLGTIGSIIQEYAEERRCSIVREFCGHGLGRLFHDSPNVLHFGTRGEGPELREGMFFTVEPMLNLGRPDAKVLADGWTAVTRDKSLSAQFEHSCGVTADGVEIFTKSPAGLDNPPYKIT